jgi:hypothetical protein
VFALGGAGRGQPVVFRGGNDTLMSIEALPNAGILVSTADPLLASFENDGTLRWARRTPNSDPGEDGILQVSPDGTLVDFGIRTGGLLRFDARRLSVTVDPPADQLTLPPKTDGLLIERWRNADFPMLGGRSIQLDNEKSRSLAINQDAKTFVLGTTWSVRAITADNKLLWRRDSPAEAWAVNVTADGRLVVAAYGDGTVRWHRMDNGREVLALMILPDKMNWVAWTPEGIYAASAAAVGVLRWHVNHGSSPATTISAFDVPGQNRPEVLALALQDLDTVGAVGLGGIRSAQQRVQSKTGTSKAPGRRLHVLAVGISEYGENAKALKLKFADKDAHDVATTLGAQSGDLHGRVGLYAEVKPIYLSNNLASKITILKALDAMAKNMDQDDLAIVMFAGHGAMLDGQFYLVPYDANVGTPVDFKFSAISATDLQDAVTRLGARGHVLVLLDACHSGAFGANDLKVRPNADVLRRIVASGASGNVSVLTSSTADQISREDDNWGHGAFTKVFLDALSGHNPSIDTDNDGVISMGELAEYLDRNLAKLTNGTQKLGVDFDLLAVFSSKAYDVQASP